MNDSIPICLIGGTGRSGTTILKRIFTKHPEAAEIPEWRFSVDPDGLVDFYVTLSAGWSPYLFDVKLKRLRRLLKSAGRSSALSNLVRRALKFSKIQGAFPRKLVPAYSEIGIGRVCPGYGRLVDDLMEALSEFRYRGVWAGQRFLEETAIEYRPPVSPTELARILGAFFRHVVEDTLNARGKSCYVEDNTWNILWFDRLLDLLPEARLVHMIRDPRDVVASFTQQTWTPKHPEKAARFYAGIMDRWWEIRPNLPAESFREIKLETLVADPEAVLRDLCRFWDIPWHKALLDTDLSRSHGGRWKTDFDEREQNALNTILGPYLQALGYDR